MYVKIVGSVKSFQSQRNLTAYVIRKIEDHNELTFHMLDATAAHLEATRGPPAVYTISLTSYILIRRLTDF